MVGRGTVQETRKAEGRGRVAIAEGIRKSVAMG